ncbi:hypothetical protein NEAUS04_0702 [Nematocida ausubeli]|uniref:DNA-directed RNA polymerase III subunit RPC3 n=1 Tax=Nematocida ausubeli (strain ATCC PRA-371 / ERTm2) TaxID=1913371 RepID=H8Z947_NEMA1|nr:uncharacterized protein NESG_00970 [Nematocida ausubeli]EHY66478.1 hypothetical protein NERG_00118 [Nematocida ausubeli]KAI5147693.1 hypothetical protein NEAUS05_0982 [Nematocida ausubeli]KAI5161743.1 hypothetical protein NEAUS04_0702 [Nematocida ausubeli]KFG26814.1 hypothetical protein NESG_00970 [Nematocida ausubeli]
MSPNERLFILELFGDVCERIGYYLLKNKDTSLISIYKGINSSRKDAVKGLSLLIHFGIVGFTNYSGRGVRYFIKQGHSSLINYPVYISYCETLYGPQGSQIVMEVLLRRKIGMSSIPEELLECAKKMLREGILAEESAQGVKRVKEDTERYLLFSKSAVDSKLLTMFFYNDILSHFSENTKRVFSAVRSFYPAPSPLNRILERCAEFHVEPEALSSTKTLSMSETVQKHIKYLIGYGAISGGYEMYQVNHESYLDKIKKNVLLEYCDMYIGSIASTVFSMLLNKGYVEDKFIQKHLLLEPQKCKNILFLLLSERFVSLQMIPRTADCAPSKSFHLWSANPRKVFAVLEQKVHSKLNENYIELFCLQKNKLFITPGEYKHKTDQIFNLLEKLHTFCFILSL